MCPVSLRAYKSPHILTNYKLLNNAFKDYIFKTNINRQFYEFKK